MHLYEQLDLYTLYELLCVHSIRIISSVHYVCTTRLLYTKNEYRRRTGREKVNGNDSEEAGCLSEEEWMKEEEARVSRRIICRTHREIYTINNHFCSDWRATVSCKLFQEARQFQFVTWAFVLYNSLSDFYGT